MGVNIRPVGPCPARIMIVGEFPGEQEIARGEAFCGYTSRDLGNMLAEAGISMSSCFMTLALRERPPKNDLSLFISKLKKPKTPDMVQVHGKWCAPCVADGLTILAREIELCNPDVVVALGDAALFVLTGISSASKWRGSELVCSIPLGLGRQVRVIPTYSPGLLYGSPEWRPIVVQDLRRAKNWEGKPVIDWPKYNFILRPNYSTARAVLSQLLEQIQLGPRDLAVDIETRAGHIACIGFAWSTRDAMCIPLMCVERQTGYWPPEEECTLMHLLYQLLTHPNIRVIGQNFLYDMQYFSRHLCFEPRVARDTMLTQHVLFAGMKKSLDFQASMYCGRYTYWKEESKDWDPKVGEDQLWAYNCKDACATFEIDQVHAQLLPKMGMEEQQAFQQTLFWPVLETMNRGIRIDNQRKGQLALELMDQIEARRAWLHQVLGYELNPNSSPQMQTLFYEELGCKPVINKKTKSISCNDEALQTLCEKEPLLLPLVQNISDIRSLGVFLNTFISAPVDVDHRMRCSFNISGTETYRFSSSQNAFGSGMNLQNIPKGGDLAATGSALPNVRSLFLPDPGYEFFDIDLAAADLRIVVWEADEPDMKEMLRAGLDPYTEIAKEFYHDPSITKKDARRQKFKSFAHGTNYLGTAKGLAGRLGLSVHEAERTQRWYFERFPKIKDNQDRLIRQVKERRYVQNIFGYRFYFRGRIEGTVFNQAAAWIPQSTVACIINRGYVNIWRNHPHIQVLLQVHDSLAGQFPISRRDESCRQIVEACSITLPYDDPLVVPVGIVTSTKSWGDCK
jgi:uracil-DNA glycosylase family 4